MSIIGAKAATRSWFMTSSGCSNMLKDRLNCFRGLATGLELFLT